MNMWAFVSMSAFMVLLALNAFVHIWAPPYPPLRRALQVSMFAYLLFGAGDVATYLVVTDAGYSAAVTTLYTGTILLSLAWWLMCQRYAESIGRPFHWAASRWAKAPLAIGFALWLALLTNPWHEQFLTPVRGTRNVYHWLWWVNTAHCYALGVLGAILYMYLRHKASSAAVKTRLSFMVGASSVVILANVIYTLTPSNLEFDPTPVALALCSALYLAGIYRVGYLSLSRLAIKTILDQQSNGLLVIDKTGSPVYWNGAAERYLGANVAQIDEHMKDWLNAALFPLDPGVPLLALAEGKEAALFSPNRRPERTLSVRLNTIESWNGDARGNCYLMEDVTEVHQRQIDKDRLQERISQAQKLDGLGILAGGIAHDFNNLLMSIKGNTELALLDLKDGNDPTERLQTLEQASNQAARLTHHLLTYAGQAPGDFSQFDLAALIRQTRQLLQTTVHHHQCELALEMAGELLVLGDEVQLEQAVMNLVINATEAARPKSTVQLSAGRTQVTAAELGSYQYGSEVNPGEYVWFEVTNSGQRLETEVIDKMFDPFFSTKREGRGLGLAAVLGIVRKHKGALRVRSWPGSESGTTVRVLIPAATIDILATVAAETTPPVRHPASKNDIILVVDDDQLARDVACRFLQSEGYSVLEASSGTQALAIASEMPEQISLVIMDVVMPDMSGSETWQLLREQQPELPVLFISGHPRGHLDNLLDGEAINYLEKPFNRISLLREVTKQLTVSSPQESHSTAQALVPDLPDPDTTGAAPS